MTTHTPLLTVDRRSLVLFRISLCLWIFRDLYRRWYYNSIEAFLTNDGVLQDSEPSFCEIREESPPFIFHRGSLQTQYIFFIIHIINTICLLLGYHVTFTSIMNYLLIYSLHARNYMILDGSDRLIRCLSFIFIFSSKFSSYTNITQMNISGINIILLLFQCWIIYPIVVIRRLFFYEIGTWLPYGNGVNTCTSVYLSLTRYTYSTNFGFYVASLSPYISYLLCLSTNVFEFVFPT
eukprot:154096_1